MDHIHGAQCQVDLAMHRVERRVKPTTWTAFRMTAIEDRTAAEAAKELGMPIGTVFVAKHRVQKLLEDEFRIMKRQRG